MKWLTEGEIHSHEGILNKISDNVHVLIEQDGNYFIITILDVEKEEIITKVKISREKLTSIPYHTSKFWMTLKVGLGKLGIRTREYDVDSELRELVNDLLSEKVKFSLFKSKEIENIPPQYFDMAKEILDKDPIDFVVETAHQLHAGDTELIKFEFISGMSFIDEEEKIHLNPIADSEMGKSHSLNTVIHGFPKENIHVFTSMSSKMLIYFVKKYGPEIFKNMVIFIDEFEASKYADPILRTLTGQTDVDMTHGSVIDQEFVEITTKYKPAMWTTSVYAMGSEQLKNRFQHASPDDSQEQDERVWKLQNKLDLGEIEIDMTKFIVMKAVIRLIIQNTKNLKVKRNFQIHWPSQYKHRRTLYKKFLAMVRIITKIRYANREIQDGYIISTKEDFDTAKEIWEKFSLNIMTRGSQTELNVLKQVPFKEYDEDFEIHEEGEEEVTMESPQPWKYATHTSISAKTHLSTNQVAEICKRLCDAGLVNSKRKETGHHEFQYWRSKELDLKDKISIIEE